MSPDKKREHNRLKLDMMQREREYYRLVDAKKAASIVYGLSLRDPINQAYQKMQAARDALTTFEKENGNDE